MKMKLVTAAVMGLAMSTAMAATDAASLATDKDKLSYSIGADLGKNFKAQSIDINTEALAKGMQDSISGTQLILTEEQMKETLSKFQKDLVAKRTAEVNKKVEENKAKSDKFFAENKTKEGVITLPSGIQYKIIEAGKGAKPSKEDTVTVEYTGRLIDGTVFDSTEKAKPVSFPLDKVIPGWTEAIQLMPAGSTWEVYIPPQFAYGTRGAGQKIGPNETLIFKIHLISFAK